jgi:DNA-binding response OmpR family regulator
MVVDDAYSDVQIVESIRRSAGHEVGAEEYLSKPFTADQLLPVVRRFLR